MIFNPDTSKQAQEVIFSGKIKKPTHSPLVFNNAIISQTNSRKHLGDTLDLKLTFEKHLLNVYKTVNRTIGFMCKLQSVLSRINLVPSTKPLRDPIWIMGYLIRPSF